MTKVCKVCSEAERRKHCSFGRNQEMLDRIVLESRTEQTIDKWINMGNIYGSKGVEGSMISRLKHPREEEAGACARSSGQCFLLAHRVRGACGEGPRRPRKLPRPSRRPTSGQTPSPTLARALAKCSSKKQSALQRQPGQEETRRELQLILPSRLQLQGVQLEGVL